ncbi:MAG: DUF4268 domain-containing protein [Planctomycetaceae bacterium]
MPLKSLSRLEPVDIADVWAHEALDFTPWLARPENIELLGGTLGLELELEGTEQSVGPFKADILCRDLSDHEEGRVLIENQLGPSDHSHLGQLLTYTAGLKAVKIVWIARRIHDQHRAAIDWLNEYTQEGIDFFGLEIELWKIGDSPPAPSFKVVCKPNVWAESVATTAKSLEAGALSATNQLYLEFWTAFCEYLLANKPGLKNQKPLAQGWYGFAIGKACFGVFAATSNQQGYIRVEFKLDGPDRARRIERLLSIQPDIESVLPPGLDWYESSKAYYVRLNRDDCDIENRSLWPEYHEWLANHVEQFRNVFAPRLNYLVTVDEESHVTSP